MNFSPTACFWISEPIFIEGSAAGVFLGNSCERRSSAASVGLNELI